MRGRPSVYTEARADTLVNAIAEGLSPKAACGRAGVSTTTFRNWVDRNVGGIAPRIAEAQLRAAALFGTPIKITQRRPQSSRPVKHKLAQPLPHPTPQPPQAPERTPDINVRVTWEITPSGAAAIAEVLNKLDRLGALAITLSALFPNGSANPELTKLLKALSASA